MRRRRAGRVVSVGALAIVLAAVFPARPAVATRSVGGAVRAATPARSPFRGLTATTIHAGGRTLRVVVAKTERQREEGLRRRADLGPYDGMLFAFPRDTQVGFTMSTVPVPLEIGFYRGNGAVVGRLHMLPCPGSESACPVYAVARSFRYALETLSAGLPVGTLSG